VRRPTQWTVPSSSSSSAPAEEEDEEPIEEEPTASGAGTRKGGGRRGGDMESSHRASGAEMRTPRESLKMSERRSCIVRTCGRVVVARRVRAASG